MKHKETIRINFLDGEDRSYNTIISSNILDKIGIAVKNLNIGKNIFIITDRKVGKLYAQRVIKSFKTAGFSDIKRIQIPSGERNKTLTTAEQIHEKLHDFDKYREKKIIIVNLGGGVVGDLGGYIAGTYRRGVNYIQIPTTLLGQVDCGLGGKVGVNFKEAKNSIGLFWQPKLVCMDLAVLKTLDKREMKSGLAEVIKYGVIKDQNLFKYIEKKWGAILNCNINVLKPIVITSVKIKAGIVEKDERDEKDIRIILNFGHTVGHAIEAASDYKYYRHGEAISVGMLCAAEIACHLGMFSETNFLRLENLIKRVGLSTKIKKCTLRRIMNSMKYDKKFINGRNRFVLPTKIGKVEIREGIDENLIKNVIRKRMS